MIFHLLFRKCIYLIYKNSKVFILTFVLIVSFYDSRSQCNQASTACENTPYNASLNLTTTAGLFVAKKITSVPYVKLVGNLPNTYSDVLYAADNCIGATSDDCNQDISSLVYDVYYPEKSISEYEACPLPAVILFHAGGFSECSNFGQPGISTICEELAKKGYVAFCVEYRRGRLKQGNKYTSVQQQLAVYRACQDARGAIRSIIKRQDNETTGDNWGDPYRINTSKIFVGGMSAGGVAAMSAAWYTDAMVSTIFTSITTPTGSTINQAL